MKRVHRDGIELAQRDLLQHPADEDTRAAAQGVLDHYIGVSAICSRAARLALAMPSLPAMVWWMNARSSDERASVFWRGLDHFKAYMSAVVAHNLALFARLKPA